MVHDGYNVLPHAELVKLLVERDATVHALEDRIRVLEDALCCFHVSKEVRMQPLPMVIENWDLFLPIAIAGAGLVHPSFPSYS